MGVGDGAIRSVEGSRPKPGLSVPVLTILDEAGAEMTFDFEGTGVVIRGSWKKDGGKADVYVDGELHRSFDTYFWYANQEKDEAFLWHVLNLEPGAHNIRLVVKGEKREISEGARVYITGVTVFKTGKKQSDLVKFSFE